MNILEMISLINKIKADFSKFIDNTLLSDVYDIDSQDFMIIFHIHNMGEQKVIVNDLQAKEFYLGMNVTYRLKKLKKNQYLNVSSHPSDGRCKFVELTDKSIKLIGKIFDSLPLLIGEEKNKEFIQLFDSLKIFDRIVIKR